MAKKQTRRSVSVRGTTYERVRLYCERIGISMSEFVEARVAEFFEAGIKDQTAALRVAAPPVSRTNGNGQHEPLSDKELHDAARFFTF
ncbi:MAG: hypothetical protein H6707_01885 [Deltaproteobacteria bacterium]|nr:hypothetical protein [Deltaproteobacteria bacterium]